MNADFHGKVRLQESMWQFYLSIMRIHMGISRINQDIKIDPHTYVKNEEASNSYGDI